jgi:hypothetical protein
MKGTNNKLYHCSEPMNHAKAPTLSSNSNTRMIILLEKLSKIGFNESRFEGSFLIPLVQIHRLKLFIYSMVKMYLQSKSFSAKKKNEKNLLGLSDPAGLLQIV